MPRRLRRRILFLRDIKADMSLILRFLFLLCSYLFVKGSGSAETCTDLGFNSQVLKCETCDDILRVVGDSSLFDECQTCCIKKADAVLFSKAVLEVDQRFVPSFQHLESIIKFIKESKETYKSKLKIKYKFGSAPYLHLYTDSTDSSPSESMSVVGWSVDDFGDYIKERLPSEVSVK